MKRGVWHQFGDRSQKMTIDHLANNLGQGVVISPRDLASHKATEYAAAYKSQGADVLFDPQFYIPDSLQGKLDTYSTTPSRKTVSQLAAISDVELGLLSSQILGISTDLGVSAIIAPAVVYEAARPDIVQLNSQLFDAAKAAAQSLGVPTYATVVLGRSVSQSNMTATDVISSATSLDADGWYFAYEFPSERIPSGEEEVVRCCHAGVRLAATGKPVMHAYAGPMSLISGGFGATAAAIGHSQNLWHFTRDRWEETASQGGGGGNAPARHFSEALWGTIIDPDEQVQLSTTLRSQILSSSPYRTPWTRWEANKHLVHIQMSVVGSIFTDLNPRNIIGMAAARLAAAVDWHDEVRAEGVVLKDDTNCYQAAWLAALHVFESQCSEDLDYLELIQ